MTSRKELAKRTNNLLGSASYTGVDYIQSGEFAQCISCLHEFPKHVVLDLETTGIEAGCGILTIGAVTLDYKHQYYVRVEIGSNEAWGLNAPEESTMLWWSRQGTKAKLEARYGTFLRFNLYDSLKGFASFLEECGATALVGNGVSFDNAIIRYAMSKLDVAMPIGFDTRKDFCYRTAKQMLPWIKARKFIGIPHHALYDALHEASHLNDILNYLHPQSKE